QNPFPVLCLMVPLVPLSPIQFVRRFVRIGRAIPVPPSAKEPRMDNIMPQLKTSVQSTYDIVCQLHDVGCYLIPTGGGDDGKKPLIPHWKQYQKRQPTSEELCHWQQKYQPSVWANVCGAASGVSVVDADTQESVGELHAHNLKPHVATPKGEHFYFKHPGYPIRPKVAVIPGIDIRGDGSYANVIGTRKDGGKYRVLVPPIEGNLYAVADLPKYIRDALLNGNKPKRVSKEALSDKTPQGERNSTLTRYAGSMRRQGATQEVILAALREINRLQCDPPLEEREIQDIAGSVAKYELGDPVSVSPEAATTSPDGYHLTDIGNAKRFADQHRDKVRYSHELKKWLRYHGGHWVEDKKGSIRSLAKSTALSWYFDVGTESDDNRRKELRKHAIDSERDFRITAMLNLAQSEPGIPVTIDEMDSDPWLFNCGNCTIDLRTGQPRPHNASDMLMQIIPVTYDAGANCPEWARFMGTITGGDKELISLLKRAVGMSLTGDVRTQLLFFLYGTGCNGKSTFLAIIRKLMGSYGLKASMSPFTIKNKGDNGPNESLANLRGKRFVMATEIEEGKRLAVATIKDMTGSEPIRADRKYEHEVEFDVTFKLWLSGNHKPIITDTTYSIWRRFKLVPFMVKIPNPEEDYSKKLEAELPGILNWAIQGCLEWQKQGLGKSVAVRTATETYQREQDVIADFLTDCCVLEPHVTIAVKDLFNAYQEWCENNVGTELGKRKFGDRLVEKGIMRVPGHANTAMWLGIRLIKEGEMVNLVNKVTQNPGTFPYTRVLDKSSGKLPELVNQINPNNPNSDIAPYPDPCYACGGEEYWITPWGEYRCCRCHPQPEGG
ncbi:phage/plasmid primase, P4 family, partial [Chloroflexota bacterium]